MDAVTSTPQSTARPPQPAARRKAPAQRRAEVIEAAAAIAVREARAWLAGADTPTSLVLCCFGGAVAAACRRELAHA